MSFSRKPLLWMGSSVRLERTAIPGTGRTE
jgi:hypothetical protein